VRLTDTTGGRVTENSFDVYIETGHKRVLAGALAWPGWTRSARDEAGALQALLDYAPRYAAALASASVAFALPESVATFNVVERLPGGTATDMGVPEAVPEADRAPVGGAELEHLETILAACWAAFDRAAVAAAVAIARGHELRTGPRGGGRDLPKMIAHVRDAEGSYLSRLGGKAPPGAAEEANADPRIDPLRRAILDTLPHAAAGELPAQGPRGGARWGARYFVRRTAWHALDHAWELEDRTE
jgi:hypothetical protein